MRLNNTFQEDRANRADSKPISVWDMPIEDCIFFLDLDRRDSEQGISSSDREKVYKAVADSLPKQAKQTKREDPQILDEHKRQEALMNALIRNRELMNKWR